MRSSVLSRIFIALLAILVTAGPSFAERQKIGPRAAKRAAHSVGTSRVIVSAAATTDLPDVAAAIDRAGGARGRALRMIDGYVAHLPNRALSELVNNPAI